MTFLAPGALLLLLPAAGVIVLPFLRRSADRRLAPAVLRALVLSLVVLALAGPRTTAAAKGRAVAFLVDVSASIPAEAAARAAAFVARARSTLSPADRAAVFVFAETPAAETPFAPPGDAPAGPAPFTARVPVEGTDVEAALRFALGALPPDLTHEIVLLTDGNENLGDGVAEAHRAAAGGASLAVLPLRYRRQDAVSVRRIEVPDIAPTGAVVTTRPLLSSTRAGVRAELRLFVDGAAAGSERVLLPAGKSLGPEFRFVLPDAGLHEVSVTVTAEGDSGAMDNEARAAVRVLGEGAVLLVEATEGASILSRALGGATIALRHARPASLPDSPLLFQPFDAVVLSDIAASELSDAQLDALEVAVRDIGTGVFVLGGESAYAPGGYRDTALERLLPVRMDLREKQVLLNGALVIILHTCEFDVGNHWALRISAAALRALTPRDFAGIIGYGPSGDEWVLPFARVENPAGLASRLTDLRTGDMPSYDSSLTLAEKALAPCPAHLKHVVVISDGDAAQPDSELVARLAAAGITVSAICVDPHSASDAATMQFLAKIGRGRFFRLDRNQVAALPRIFVTEATTLRRAAIRKEPFVPILVAGGPDAHPAVKGLAPPLPRLAAMTRTEVKERAEMLISGPDGDPVLAFWRYGLGATAAFTSALAGGWIGDWAEMEGLDRFLVQTVRSVARTAGRPGYSATAEVTRGTARIRLRAVSTTGEEHDFLRVEGALVRPGEATVPFPLAPRGGGIHEGSVSLRGGGRALAVLRFTDPETGDPAQVEVPLRGDPAEEFLATEPDDSFFVRLAAEAGATILGPDDPLPAPPAARATAGANPVPWLLAVAALLLVADLALRRLRPDFRRLIALLPRRAAPATAAAGDAGDEHHAPAPREKPVSGEAPPVAPEPPAAGAADRLDALERAKRRGRESRRWEETGHGS
ncbi:MAG: VWA domain-containing protein [Planctomycetes bacterium]|nr:VWA domain-containing protein [Planctomycetota bacterium]